MRLDRFLSQLGIGTRSQVKDLIRKKQVTVGGSVVTSPEFQVNPESDNIVCQGKTLVYQEYQYYMLNKPAGVVTATRDALSDTVMQLLPKSRAKDLFPVGRLDKDTEGLLIITNDGAMAHDLLSPKKHVAKTYLVKLRDTLSDEALAALENGIDLGEEGLTAPAKVARLYDADKEGSWIHLTITEGRFHQVKRMLSLVGNEVLYLKRIRFGALALDEGLKSGECRALTEEEVNRLKRSREIAKEKQSLLQGKKAVIFDLDGSLVDSMWLWGKIDQEYLGRFGIQLESREELRHKIEGMSFHETAVYFQKAFQLPDTVEKMKDDWNKMAWDMYANEVPLKPGVIDFLEGCRRNQIPLGIATSNSRELVENVLRVHHLLDKFQSIVTGNEIVKGKPAPDVYLTVAEHLGIDPKDCLVFEDIIKGIMAGKNAGMTVCTIADADSHDTWDTKCEISDYAIFDFYDFWS